MPWFSFRRKRDDDLDDEIRHHLTLATQERTAHGEAPQEAALQARREFGNLGLVTETTRSMWRWQIVESLWQDLRYAVRSLRGSPVFTIIAVASLSLGIGANTAIFSFVNALLLKRLPVPAPTQLIEFAGYENGRLVDSNFSYPFLMELDKQNSVFDGVFGRFPVRVNLTIQGLAEPLNGELVTGNYFKTLQVKAALGRLLTADDVDAGSGNPVCVISYFTWQYRFAGDPGIIGRKLLLNARPYTVIGVTERGFYGSQLQSRAEIQLPVSRMGEFMGGFFSSVFGQQVWKTPGFAWLEPLARLKPGVSAQRAQSMINSIAQSIRNQLPDSHATRPVSQELLRISDGSQGVSNDTNYSKPITVLMAVVAVVLLIACANLANLLLARASARSKECAVRLSLGAGRWRLIRQFMMESLLIAGLSCIVGIALAFWINRTLLTYLNSGRPGEGIQASLDPLVLCFSALLSLLTAILFGLVPALQSVQPDLLPELKGGPGQMEANPTGLRIRRSLIVLEIALSLVILFSAGLLTRTLSGLRTIDLGFNPEHVLTLKVDPAMNGYSAVQSEQMFDQILARLRAQPGIAAASLATVTPLEGAMIAMKIDVPGHLKKSSDIQTDFNTVSPNYFNTLDQKLLAGRDFTDADVRKAQGVAVVNERFVQQYMPGLNPIGRHFKVGGGDTEIVGLVRNAHYQTLREQQLPLVYLAIKQTTSSGSTLLVRTRMESSRVVADVERTIRSVAPRLPIYDVRELQSTIDQGISAERVLSFLSTLFSALATLLCAIGIYGVIAYAVSRRTREIGVRFAVGAQRSDVARLFLRESAILVFAGIIIGIPLALSSARILKSLLYGVTPADPVALAATIAIFLAAGLLASLLPVMRAARIEVLSALRYE